MVKPPVPEATLFSLLQRTFGSRCYPVSGKPLTNGTRKQVWLFSLRGAGPRQVVLLVWNNEQDYFDEQGDPDNTLNDLNAPNLYRANTDLLLSRGLSVPGLYEFDDSRKVVPHAFALVEYIQSQTFNEYIAGKPESEVDRVLSRMHEYLQHMHAVTRAYPGTVLQQAPDGAGCLDETLTMALSDLNGLAQAHPGVQRYAEAARKRLTDLRSQIKPRDKYAFIHGELGPDEHFLVNRQGQITILDVDGCLYGDIEREHAYLKLRFKAYEQAFRRPDLDPLRMDFYGLYLHISAAYGHYRLLVKGYPGADMLRSIYEWNAAQVVRLVGGTEAQQ